MPLTVYIIEQSFIAKLAAKKLRSKQMAITIGNKIYLHQISKIDFLSNKNWLCHELKHVQQFKKDGFIVFIVKYIWESICKGYYNNKWEVEARHSEQDFSLLNEFKID